MVILHILNIVKYNTGHCHARVFLETCSLYFFEKKQHHHQHHPLQVRKNGACTTALLTLFFFCAVAHYPHDFLYTPSLSWVHIYKNVIFI